MAISVLEIATSASGLLAMTQILPGVYSPAVRAPTGLCDLRVPLVMSGFHCIPVKE